MALIPGVKINLNGKVFLVPALTLPEVRRLAPDLEVVRGIVGVPTAEQVTSLVEVVRSAVVRNYPEVTAQELEEGLDMRNMIPTLQAVMASSGFVEEGTGEAAGQPVS